PRLRSCPAAWVRPIRAPTRRGRPRSASRSGPGSSPWGAVCQAGKGYELHMADYNQAIIDEFRGNGGRVGGPFEGAPLLLLHTIGAKSGKERVNPVMYQAVGESYSVFASKGG